MQDRFNHRQLLNMALDAAGDARALDAEDDRLGALSKVAMYFMYMDILGRTPYPKREKVPQEWCGSCNKETRQLVDYGTYPPGVLPTACGTCHPDHWPLEPVNLDW